VVLWLPFVSIADMLVDATAHNLFPFEFAMPSWHRVPSCHRVEIVVPSCRRARRVVVFEFVFCISWKKVFLLIF
jgi:hypothetical protein